MNLALKVSCCCAWDTTGAFIDCGARRKDIVRFSVYKSVKGDEGTKDWSVRVVTLSGTNRSEKYEGGVLRCGPGSEDHTGPWDGKERKNVHI